MVFSDDDVLKLIQLVKLLISDLKALNADNGLVQHAKDVIEDIMSKQNKGETGEPK